VEFLLKGIMLGLAAGISPGPLSALLFAETLKGSWKAGASVAFAPLLTDAPIIIVSLLFAIRISQYSWVLGALSILGAFYLIYLGYENLTINTSVNEDKRNSVGSLKKGIITNFLNPNPYIFWVTIGAPTLVIGSGENFYFAVYFIMGFYFFLIGTKIALVFLIVKSGKFLSDATYTTAIKFSGIILFLVAVFYFYNGLILMK
jgi:threonine/homoserine/homoserine lactone efflux protein